MKRILFFLTLFLVLSTLGYSQSFFRKSTKSVYALYGRHFPTHFIVDSGSGNLVGRKMNISWEAGLNLDYPFNKKWSLRSGIAGHIQVISDITYGTTTVPNSIKPEFQNEEKRYIKGSEFRERISIGLPVKGLFKIINSSKWEILLTGGPFINFYFPTRDEEIRSILLYTRTSGGYDRYLKYEIIREFDQKKVLSGPDFSKPQLEWQLDLEVVRKLKKRGAITAGIKLHAGTKKLEKANFIIWPEISGYRSKGHFTLNRSYIGVYAGFRFSHK